MRDTIETELQAVEATHNVRILMAVESGSRAWGFASPDSDYDVRFIYVHPLTTYLRLNPPRDVLEWQLDDVLDINGWDLRKALTLLRTSNPTLFEWCASPIIYRDTPEAHALRALCPHCFSVKKALCHYIHMAERNRHAYLTGPTVRLKKYFYVLRPLLAAQWIDERKTPPPMRFTDLADALLPPELAPDITRLLAQKQSATEHDTIPRIPAFHTYIDAQLQHLADLAQSTPEHHADWEPLNQFFLSVLNP